MSARAELPARRLALSAALHWNGQAWLLSVGFDRDGVAREIFLKGSKSGADLEALADDLCIVASRALQRGERVAEVYASLRGLGETGAAAPSLLRLALEAAARLEAEEQEAIADAYRFAAYLGA